LRRLNEPGHALAAAAAAAAATSSTPSTSILTRDGARARHWRGLIGWAPNVLNQNFGHFKFWSPIQNLNQFEQSK
jgi:hypothetical protein